MESRSLASVKTYIQRGEFSAALEEVKKGGQYVVDFEYCREELAPSPTQWICKLKLFPANQERAGPPIFTATSQPLRSKRDAYNTASEKILRSLMPELFRVDTAVPDQPARDDVLRSIESRLSTLETQMSLLTSHLGCGIKK